jgi:hypothetical protein
VNAIRPAHPAVSINIARNAIGAFLFAYGIVGFLSFTYLNQHWVQLAPRTPDPAHGLVYRHNEKGHGTTYFSAFQGTACSLLFSTSVPLGMLGGLICPRKNERYKSNFLSARVTYDADDPFKVRPWGALAGLIFGLAFIFRIGPFLIDWLNSLGFVSHF